MMIYCLIALAAYVIATPYFYWKFMESGRKNCEELLVAQKEQFDSVLEEYRNLLLDYENAIRFGIEVGKRPEKQVQMPLFDRTHKEKPEMSAEDKRMVQIMANLDRYDGTPNGQVKING